MDVHDRDDDVIRPGDNPMVLETVIAKSLIVFGLTVYACMWIVFTPVRLIRRLRR